MPLQPQGAELLFKRCWRRKNSVLKLAVRLPERNSVSQISSSRRGHFSNPSIKRSLVVLAAKHKPRQWHQLKKISYKFHQAHRMPKQQFSVLQPRSIRHFKMQKRHRQSRVESQLCMVKVAMTTLISMLVITRLKNHLIVTQIDQINLSEKRNKLSKKKNNYIK